MSDDETVNVHEAYSIGYALLTDMDGQILSEYVMRKKHQTINFANKNKVISMKMIQFQLTQNCCFNDLSWWLKIRRLPLMKLYTMSSLAFPHQFLKIWLSWDLQINSTCRRSGQNIQPWQTLHTRSVAAISHTICVRRWFSNTETAMAEKKQHFSTSSVYMLTTLKRNITKVSPLFFMDTQITQKPKTKHTKEES